MPKRLPFFLCLLLMIGIPSPMRASEESLQDAVISQTYDASEETSVLEGGKGDTILSLSLSRDLSRSMQYTFDKDLPVSGEGRPGSLIRLVVFTENEDHSPIVWYQSEKELGPSGLLEESVPLSIAGDQYLMIGVTEDGATACRFYLICRKSEETLEELLHYRLNLFEEFGQ